MLLDVSVGCEGWGEILVVRMGVGGCEDTVWRFESGELPRVSRESRTCLSGPVFVWMPWTGTPLSVRIFATSSRGEDVAETKRSDMMLWIPGQEETLRL